MILLNSTVKTNLSLTLLKRKTKSVLVLLCAPQTIKVIVTGCGNSYSGQDMKFVCVLC